MRHLLAFSLCLASTILASGDELDASFDSGSEPVAASTNTHSPVAVPTGEGVPKGDDTIVWHPRLQIILNPSTIQPMTNFITEKVQVATQSEVGSKQDGPVVYRDVEVRRPLAVSLTDIATLYCDTMTLNVLGDGDTPNYSIECESRVSIKLNGIVIDADSASLKDGKCELVNATLTHGKMTATAQQLTLSVPIHGVLTNSFGRPVPETPPAMNLVSSPPLIDGFLLPKPDPISSPQTYQFESDKPYQKK